MKETGCKCRMVIYLQWINVTNWGMYKQKVKTEIELKKTKEQKQS